MVILFANQKGGVGKSTLAILFSNYLALVHKRNIVIFDMDNQQSIYTKFQRASILENEPFYDVELAEINQFTTIREILTQNDDVISIFDVAGNIEDNNLIPVFRGVDLIICPFYYDEFTVYATLDFSEIVKVYNPSAKIVFVPNRIKGTVKYETLKSVNKALKKYGPVTQSISERVDFQRVNTYEISEVVLPIVAPIFDLIYNNFLRAK